MATRLARQLGASGASGTAYNVLALATPRKPPLKQQVSDLGDGLATPVREPCMYSPSATTDSVKKSKKKLLRLFSSKTQSKRGSVYFITKLFITNHFDCGKFFMYVA